MSLTVVPTLTSEDTWQLAVTVDGSQWINNGFFDAGLAYWSAASLPASVVAGVLQLSAPAATGGAFNAYIAQNAVIGPAGDYVLRFTGRASVNGAGMSIAMPSVQSVVLSTTAARYALTYAGFAAGASASPGFAVGNGFPSAWTCYLDEISITHGLLSEEFTVDWGDGSAPQTVRVNLNVASGTTTLVTNVSHTFADPGSHNYRATVTHAGQTANVALTVRPLTLTATWYELFGYVRFVVTDATPGLTVKRVIPGGQLMAIYGFESDAWLASGDGFGEDYRPPLGTDVEYVVAPVDAWQDSPSYPRVTVTTPGNEAWLRDVSFPVLARGVMVEETGTESEGITQRVYNISGRRLPLVVHDVRHGRTGTVSLIVRDRDERTALEGLLSTGNPLLLTLCYDKAWQPCMMAVGDASFTRISNQASWRLALTYTEVADPLANIHRVPAAIWQDVWDGKPIKPGETPAQVTWAWVRNNYRSWLRVAIAERV